MTEAESLGAGTVEQTLADLQHGRSIYSLDGRSQKRDLRLRVREAAAWCAHHLDLAAIATSLRPLDLCPRPLASDRWTEVEDVVRERRRALDKVPSWDAQSPQGRVLVYYPDANLFDGAAANATGGFLNVHNAPPWGTWVGYFHDRSAEMSSAGYLLAWIPEILVPTVGEGIDVNPEHCIEWFSESDVRLRSVIKPSVLWDRG